jgi:hypothetical protein
MAVSAAPKRIQFRLGVKLGVAAVPYRFFATVDHLTVTPTSATVAVYASDGTTSKLASTAMTAANPCTYTFDFSNTTTWPVGTYQVEHTFISGGVTYRPNRRLLGIYAQVPEPMVTDEDLLERHPDLNNYLDTLTNWVSFIEEGWNSTLFRLSMMLRPDGGYLDPYEIADGTKLYHAHLYQTLRQVFAHLRVVDQDRFGLLAQNYAEMFDEQIAQLEANKLALWTTGPTVVEETRERGSLRTHLRYYAPDGLNPSSIADVTPKADRDQEF